jgi:hypothetical protein
MPTQPRYLKRHTPDSRHETRHEDNRRRGREKKWRVKTREHNEHKWTQRDSNRRRNNRVARRCPVFAILILAVILARDLAFACCSTGASRLGGRG